MTARERPDALLEACIGRVAGGDRDALGLLYEQAKASVYGFALSILRNRQDAEDVLQDTFVSAAASAGGYRPMGKPMAWLLTIARNCALMKMRTRNRTADASDMFWEQLEADKAPVSSEDRLLLDAALDILNTEESQIVMLHAVAGFKHREIAELLGLPLSTALSKYNRAIKKLHSFLLKTGGAESKPHLSKRGFLR